ncbi:MAG TPA: 30S ribosomal protein S4e [Candidatus Diapherotrites archaeon]|nr:30S ribosomal protein S4e [Candidatus Diapherotrites archaeon]
MAKKGSTRVLKVNKARAITGVDKTRRFIIRPSPGKHELNSAVSIGYILRDTLHLADNLKEIKYILHNKDVLVDSKVVTSYSFPVGLFDVISIPKLNKYYKVIFLKNGPLSLKEINKDESKEKICKIVKKKKIKGNNFQLITNDGRTIITSNSAYKTRSSVKLNLDENTIKEYLPLEVGRKVYIISGKHIGQTAIIEAISPGTLQKPWLLKLKDHDDEFETIEKNVIVIG